MGLFLSVSGILTSDGGAVRDVIQQYVAGYGGTLELRTDDDDRLGVIQSTDTTTTVVYPHHFVGWDDVSKVISKELKTAVFSFHIHDGDFWMFIAFRDGDEVAWFNPRPDYWEPIDDLERTRWAGNPDIVASLVPGLAARMIERYFVPWTDDILTARVKSYDDDESTIGSEWQLTDFMRRLGFVYPFDQQGEPTGQNFQLTDPRIAPTSLYQVIPEHQRSVTSEKQARPWWKFW